MIGPAIRVDMQLFIPHDVGSPRIGKTGVTGLEDKRTNAGFEWESVGYHTSRHPRRGRGEGGIFKFRMGLIEHLSQGLERKSSSMQKKEKEGERQGERAGGRDREGKRKRRRKRRERPGEGKEVKVRRRPVLAAHPRFRATAFLPSSSSSPAPPSRYRRRFSPCLRSHLRFTRARR